MAEWRPKIRKSDQEIKANLSVGVSPESTSAFERQFAQNFRIQTPDGVFEAIDVKPGQLKDSVPVVVASGLGATTDVNKKIIENEYKLGREVLSLDHTQRGGIVQKAKSLIALVEHRGGPVDVIGHSEAGIYVAIAATTRPDLFRNIVFVDPAGMVGKESFYSSLRRQNTENKALKTIKKEEPESQEAMQKADAVFNRHLLSDPFRAVSEVREMSTTQVNDMLKDLRTKGISIAIIHGVDDAVFPMDRMQEKIKVAEVDGFYSVAGRHNEIQMHPHVYTKLADEALTALQAKRIKQARESVGV